MESNNMENSSVPHFFKKNEMKFGGEENNKTIILNNNLNNLNNNPQDTKERMQNLFPNLPQEDINNVLERAEYNIEKAIILIKEIKEQKNKLNTLKNPINQNNRKRLIKRNYNSILQQEQKRNDIHSYNINNINNNRNITTNLENNTNDNNKNIDGINPGKIDIKNNNLADKNDSDINSQKKKFSPTQARESNINNNNNNNDIQKKEESELNNNNNDSMDENRKNLINAQINFLLGKFSKMNDISELKKLLKEIGFPEKKENKDEKENENNNNKLEEELKEKIEDNKEERKFIINQYKKHNAICEIIKQREDKIDELTSTLGNLIDAESEQKMREEEYKNELMEYVKSLSENNNFNFPREGY